MNFAMLQSTRPVRRSKKKQPAPANPRRFCLPTVHLGVVSSQPAPFNRVLSPLPHASPEAILEQRQQATQQAQRQRFLRLTRRYRGQCFPSPLLFSSTTPCDESSCASPAMQQHQSSSDEGASCEQVDNPRLGMRSVNVKRDGLDFSDAAPHKNGPQLPPLAERHEPLPCTLASSLHPFARCVVLPHSSLSVDSVERTVRAPLSKPPANSTTKKRLEAGALEDVLLQRVVHRLECKQLFSNNDDCKGDDVAAVHGNSPRSLLLTGGAAGAKSRSPPNGDTAEPSKTIAFRALDVKQSRQRKDKKATAITLAEDTRLPDSVALRCAAEQLQRSYPQQRLALFSMTESEVLLGILRPQHQGR